MSNSLVTSSLIDSNAVSISTSNGSSLSFHNLSNHKSNADSNKQTNIKSINTDIAVDNLLKRNEFTDYTADDFDNVAYANNILSHKNTSTNDDETQKDSNSNNVDAQDLSTVIARINIGIETLTTFIKNEVLLRYDDLMHQIPQLTSLNTSVNSIKPKLDLLNDSMNRISNQFIPFYSSLAKNIETIDKVHQATRLLNIVSYYYYIKRRIHELSSILKQSEDAYSRSVQKDELNNVNTGDKGVVRKLIASLHKDLQLLLADRGLDGIVLPEIQSS